jgi:hypothetical protein
MKIAEYIYSVRTGDLRGRGVYILRPDWWLERPRSIYILRPDWWLERPRSIYTPRERKVLSQR